MKRRQGSGEKKAKPKARSEGRLEKGTSAQAKTRKGGKEKIVSQEGKREISETLTNSKKH